MNAKLKMLLRTAQVHFPFLLDVKFALLRRYRTARGVPFDRDFDAIRLFPETEGSLFLDVGANRGQSTDAILLMTKRSRVQLFEPNPQLCVKLRRQFHANPRIVVNEFGLGNETSELPLYIPFYKRWMFDGLASFSEEKAGTWLEGRIHFYRSKHVFLHKVTANIRRLDDLQLAPFFVKLDVQGYEFEVLQGGEKTIRTYEPILLIESPPGEQIISFLRRLGYEYYSYRDHHFIHGIAEGNNTFFMTSSKSCLINTHIV